MEVKYGLFSCDSHAQLDRDAWTARMSKAQWGDRIPQIVEVSENGQIADRWMVNGKVRSEWVCNCPAAMEAWCRTRLLSAALGRSAEDRLRSDRAIESLG